MTEAPSTSRAEREPSKEQFGIAVGVAGEVTTAPNKVKDGLTDQDKGRITPDGSGSFVFDGMGDATGGELADIGAQAAVKASEQFFKNRPNLTLDQAKRAMEEVGTAVSKAIGEERDKGVISSGADAAFVGVQMCSAKESPDQDAQPWAIVGWKGDCAAFLVRNGEVIRLTTEETVAGEEAMQSGDYTGIDANVIKGAASSRAVVHINAIKLQPGDRIVETTDGLEGLYTVKGRAYFKQWNGEATQPEDIAVGEPFANIASRQKRPEEIARELVDAEGRSPSAKNDDKRVHVRDILDIPGMTPGSEAQSQEEAKVSFLPEALASLPPNISDEARRVLHSAGESLENGKPSEALQAIIDKIQSNGNPADLAHNAEVSTLLTIADRWLELAEDSNLFSKEVSANFDHSLESIHATYEKAFENDSYEMHHELTADELKEHGYFHALQNRIDRLEEIKKRQGNLNDRGQTKLDEAVQACNSLIDEVIPQFENLFNGTVHSKEGILHKLRSFRVGAKAVGAAFGEKLNFKGNVLDRVKHMNWRVAAEFGKQYARATERHKWAGVLGVAGYFVGVTAAKYGLNLLDGSEGGHTEAMQHMAATEVLTDPQPGVHEIPLGGHDSFLLPDGYTAHSAGNGWDVYHQNELITHVSTEGGLSTAEQQQVIQDFKAHGLNINIAEHPVEGAEKTAQQIQVASREWLPGENEQRLDVFRQGDHMVISIDRMTAHGTEGLDPTKGNMSAAVMVDGHSYEVPFDQSGHIRVPIDSELGKILNHNQFQYIEASRLQDLGNGHVKLEEVATEVGKGGGKVSGSLDIGHQQGTQYEVHVTSPPSGEEGEGSAVQPGTPGPGETTSPPGTETEPSPTPTQSSTPENAVTPPPEPPPPEPPATESGGGNTLVTQGAGLSLGLAGMEVGARADRAKIDKQRERALGERLRATVDKITHNIFNIPKDERSITKIMEQIKGDVAAALAEGVDPGQIAASVTAELRDRRNAPFAVDVIANGEDVVISLRPKPGESLTEQEVGDWIGDIAMVGREIRTLNNADLEDQDKLRNMFMTVYRRVGADQEYERVLRNVGLDADIFEGGPQAFTVKPDKVFDVAQILRRVKQDTVPA